MTWAGSMPAGALAIWPVTSWLGPVVSYNVLMLLSPALSAWTAFLLAKYVTRDPLASLFAGYFYGFSSYEIGHMLGHLNLVLIFVVPLFVLIVVKRFRGELSLFQFVAAVAVTLLIQLGLSTEYLATACLCGAIARGMFFVCAASNDRKRLWNLGLEIAFVAGARKSALAASNFGRLNRILRREPETRLVNFLHTMLTLFAEAKGIGGVHREVVAVRLSSRNVFLPDPAFFSSE